MMKQKILMIMLFMMGMGAQAQIPSQVIDVMKKCEAAMDSPKGVQIDMDMTAGFAIFKMKGTLTSYNKGDLSLTTMKAKMMGKEVFEESGCDGKQEWKYEKSGKDNDATLTISPASGKKNGDFDIDLDIQKEYRKAKMKEKDDRYVITFTEPIDKDSPKKVVMEIDKEKYYMRNMKASQSGVTMTLKVKKIKYGVSDAVFRLDMNRYKGAKVIKK